ncbi:MAG: enoyl-CoA hydratase-related protein [Bryobacteraceae bacterium]|nr:enoyl-CoA hydratase-related protein [Bryobacteraceae bacterium]
MNELLAAREDRVLRLTLNRDDKRNALSVALCREIVSQCEAADGDAGVGCVLLDAVGSVFCAGMDLSETTRPEAAAETAVHERLFTLGLRMTKPLVAAVQGPALGGGVGLVAAAHVALAAQGTSFALTEIRVGMWPFVIWRAIEAAVGERRAVALAMTGRVFSVHEALQWGLVHEVAPAVELDDRATETAQRLSKASPETMRRGLEFVRRARGMSKEESGRLAAMLRAEVFASDDYREGVAAFREKRAPRWPSLGATTTS